MRLPIRGRRESEGRVVAIEDSTLARAGEAATRLALEETLLRRGWRVLFLDDQFGPLFGPQRPKLFDGIAVRMRPGSADKVELRLVHMESDTLDASSELVERVKKAARLATVEWLVAAFDGEAMRVVPELNEIESVAARPSSPPAESTVATRVSAPPVSTLTPASGRPARPIPEVLPAPGGATGRAAAGRRRPPRGRPADAPAAAPASGGRPSGRAGGATAAAPGGGRRGGASPAAARPGPAPVSPRSESSSAAQAPGSSEPGAKRGRRRGKRGGRRRSGRPATS